MASSCARCAARRTSPDFSISGQKLRVDVHKAEPSATGRVALSLSPPSCHPRRIPSCSRCSRLCSQTPRLCFSRLHSGATPSSSRTSHMPSTYPGDCRRCLSELYGGMLKHMRSGRIQPSLTTPCRRRPNTFAAKNARLKTGRSAETRPKWHGASLQNGRQCMTSVSNSSHPARCDTRPSVRLVSSNCHERRAVRARAQAWVAEGRTTGGEQSLDADHSG